MPVIGGSTVPPPFALAPNPNSERDLPTSALSFSGIADQVGPPKIVHALEHRSMESTSVLEAVVPSIDETTSAESMAESLPKTSALARLLLGSLFAEPARSSFVVPGSEMTYIFK